MFLLQVVDDFSWAVFSTVWVVVVLVFLYLCRFSPNLRRDENSLQWTDWWKKERKEERERMREIVWNRFFTLRGYERGNQFPNRESNERNFRRLQSRVAARSVVYSSLACFLPYRLPHSCDLRLDHLLNFGFRERKRRQSSFFLFSHSQTLHHDLHDKTLP